MKPQGTNIFGPNLHFQLFEEYRAWLGPGSKYVIHILDRPLYLPTFNEIAHFTFDDNTDRLRYVQKKRDCDNFAAIYMVRCQEWFIENFPTLSNSVAVGLLAGYIQGWQEHARNIIVTADKGAWSIEPQTDHFLRLEDLGDNSTITGMWFL